jgi:phage tail sheath protein FI
MVTGAKNESAVLQAFSKLSYVRIIFEVGLLENKTYPWMAASPDGVAVVGFMPEENIVASIEIKTRVSTEQIQQAEEIAAKYQHKLIVCDIGDETWKECIEEEHSTQVLLQLWVMRLQLAFYIVATPGSSTSNGKITYIFMGNLILDYANQFFDQYLDCIKNHTELRALPRYEKQFHMT